jgi:hypothetical protein
LRLRTFIAGTFLLVLFSSGCETKYGPPPTKEEAAKQEPVPLPKGKDASRTASD